jgi:hypothetical protein
VSAGTQVYYASFDDVFLKLSPILRARIEWQADHAPLLGNVCRGSLLQSRKGISEIESKAARVAASKRGQRTSFNSLRANDRVFADERNGARGTRDIEGKAARVAASECGQRASFNSCHRRAAASSVCRYQVSRDEPRFVAASVDCGRRLITSIISGNDAWAVYCCGCVFLNPAV